MFVTRENVVTNGTQMFAFLEVNQVHVQFYLLFCYERFRTKIALKWPWINM
jgi:hypothetical protein